MFHISDTRSVRTGLILTFAVALGLLLAMVFYAGWRYTQLLDELAATHVLSLQAIEHSRAAQVDFKKQVQEWKDILLRGHEPADYRKYLRQFHQEEQAVRGALRRLMPLLEDVPEARHHAEQFLLAHIRLGKDYRKALAHLDPNQPGAYRKVDRLVRGIDRAPTEILDQVVEDVMAHQSARLTQLDRQLARELGASFLAGIALLVATSAFLYRFIDRHVTSPLLEATQAARRIADGNLGERIDCTGVGEAKRLLMALDEMQTSLARSQTELQESESRFRRLFEGTDAIAVHGYDRKRRVIYWNSASERLYGYSAAQALGRRFEDLLAFDSMRESLVAAIEAWISGDTSMPSAELTLRRADGSPVPVYSNRVLLRDRDDEPEVYCIDIDLSEQKQAEARIGILSQAIEQSPVSVMITDSEGGIDYVNRAFTRLTGHAADEVVGQDLRSMGQVSGGLYARLWQVISREGPWEGELQSSRENGESFWCYAHHAPVLDVSGAIRHRLLVLEDITLRKRQEERILYQAHFDALTKLPNRFLVLDRLSQLLTEAHRDDERVAVLFMDLDDFKKINDSLGHETGDRLLVEVARRLVEVVRRSDTLGRLGGDEFVCLLRGFTDVTEVQVVAEKLIEQFRNAFRVDDRELFLTASIGMSIYPEDGRSASELLRNADAAMYHAKQRGRNIYAYFTEAMNREVMRRLTLEEQMHGALERGEFLLHYQPQVEIGSGRVIGAEALLRWHNPELGDISPGEFIPISEHTGLILPIGKYVLTKTLGVAAECQRLFGRSFRFAVNLSPHQFRDPGLVSFVQEAMRHAGVSSEVLELEITEGVLMSGHALVNDALRALSDLGLNIAMDDFGTGYSSLSYLRRYPFDVLKVDRSFVQELTINASDRELVSATIRMAHGLGLKVVAEGVETMAQLEILAGLQCDYAQGYLFSRPVPKEELLVLLRGAEPLLERDWTCTARALPWPEDPGSAQRRATA